MSTRKHTERGQVLVLLTVGIITLLGFTALAIDGGRLYSERRTIQGVSDTSSLTGALYIAQQISDAGTADLGVAHDVAIQRATNNGYDSSVTTVSITEDSNYYYVETTIHTSIDPMIVQLVYDGPLSVAATSMARVPKNTVFALGQALFSISKTECPGINFHGNSEMDIENTGIFSSSECPNSVWYHGNPTVDIEGTVSAVGGIVTSGSASVTVGGEQATATPYEIEKIPEPSCAGLPTFTNDNADPLQPGIYTNGIHLTGNGSMTMAPGLYCLDDDLSINSSQSTLTGEGVTIFMRDGGVHINGGEITLTAPSGDQWVDGAGDPWNGMLIFYAYDNTDTLVLNGTADSYFEGTVYNYNDLCKINGTGSLDSYNTQIVCDYIEVIGDSEIAIEYNPEQQYIPPTTLDLVE